MDLKVIENLRDDTNVKLIKSYCNKILKKLSFKSSNDLGNLSMLVRVLYVFDMYKQALETADIIKDVEFAGDYTVWTKVEVTRATAIKILRRQGKDEEAVHVLESLIPHLGPELYENQRDMLESIYERNVQNAIKNGWKAEARDWKLVKLGMMILHSETPDFPMDKTKLNNDILELKNELKTMIR